MEIVGSLRTRAGLFKTEAAGHRILRIRGHAKGSDEADDRFGAYPSAQKWIELANLRSEIARRAEGIMPGAIEFGRIHFEMLDAGARLDWCVEDTPYFARWQRSVLPIRTNPGFLRIAGNEAGSPAQGWLTLVNVRVPNAQINSGEHPAVHLIMDFRRKTGED